MTKLFLFSSITAIVIMMTGCASTPQPRYYTLDMASSGQTTASKNIDIVRLTSSESITRTDILIKKNPTEIEYYAEHKWASNIGELVREKLESEFGQHIDDRKTIFISGIILAFEQVDVAGGAEGHIKMELEFRGEDMRTHDKPLLKKAYECSIPATTPEAGSAVKALSSGLEIIATKIAEDASRF